MIKTYFFNKHVLVLSFAALLFTTACKKASVKPTPAVVDTLANATPVKLGLYEGSDTGIFKEIQIAVTKVGTVTTSNGLVFDTGSGGMVLDASGILQASMITDNGFVFSGDSIVVSGITITNQKGQIQYGAGTDSSTNTTVYGNLAYAPVVIGNNGSTINIKRLPFMLYYKATDNKGNKFPVHYFDIFGSAPEYDLVFDNGVHITSPFSYYDAGKGLSRGFKMAALGTSAFTNDYNLNYVPNVLTVGLTASDGAASGFTMSTLPFDSQNGYLPYLKSTVTYSGKSFSTYILFDTGTAPYNYFFTSSYTGSPTLLPVGTNVSIATNSGFKWDYTITSKEYQTYLENSPTSVSSSIAGIEFFLNNEYLLDYTRNELGVKNN